MARHPIYGYLPNFDPYARHFGRDRFAAGRLTQHGGATYVLYTGAVDDFIASGMVLSSEVPGEPNCARRGVMKVRRSDCRLQIIRCRQSRRMRIIARPDLAEEDELALIEHFHELRRRAHQIERAQIAKQDVAFRAFMGAVLAKPKRPRRGARS